MGAPNIKQVAATALSNIERILSHWLPGGKTHGAEYQAINPTRIDSKLGSFSINLNTGAWSDFATEDKGGDLVALVAYIEGVKQGEAAKMLASFLGMTTEKPGTQKRATGAQKAGGDTPTQSAQRKPPIAPAKAAAADADVCVMPIPDDAPAPPASHSRHGKPSQRYAYTTAAGAVNFYHDRYEAKKEGERKQFAPLTLWRSVAGKLKWQFKAASDPRPLFGLPSLLAQPDADAWICEGEKAAQALAVLLPEHPVLTWQGGAQAVSKADFSPLAGRACIIWPDNDEAGHKAAADLVKQLQAAGAASVRVLDLAALALTAGWSSADVYTATLEASEPLAAGDDAADLVARGWQAAHFALLQQRGGLFVEATAQAASAPEEASAPAPKSETRRRYFYTEPDGVYVVEPTKSGEAYCAPRVVCDRLEVLALARDPANGGWGLLVEFADRDSVKHRLVVPARSFNGEGLEATGLLYDEGLYIAPGGRRAVLDYLQTQNPDKRARTTSRTGWHGEADELLFVLPDGAIGAATDEWLFDSGAPDASPYKQRGTLKQWRESVASLCAGNSRLVFAVCSAFASPLLHLLGEESGGFHYRGDSSGGKTTALRAAASVCGSPDYMQRWRATDNGLEALAMTHCDAPLLLDELKQIDAKVAGETAYMLANGSGKARANEKGGARTIARWRLIFLSAGELSLSQHMAEVGKKVHAGQELRLADIPADAGAGLGCFEQLHGKAGGHEFANALAAAMGKYYGTAFPAFVQKALAEREQLGASLREAQAAFEKVTLTDRASGQARRVAARFALVGAAGELATSWGITGWEPREAMQAAGACFKAWMEGRGGEGNQEERAMLAQVREFLERHGEARFTDWHRPVSKDDHAPRVMNKAGFRKHDDLGEKTEYFIYPEVFRAEVCKGHDHKAVARLLMGRSYITGEKGRPDAKRSLPGEGYRRMYHILPALWEGEDA